MAVLSHPPEARYPAPPSALVFLACFHSTDSYSRLGLHTYSKRRSFLLRFSPISPLEPASQPRRFSRTRFAKNCHVGRHPGRAGTVTFTSARWRYPVHLVFWYPNRGRLAMRYVSDKPRPVILHIVPEGSPGDTLAISRIDQAWVATSHGRCRGRHLADTGRI